MKIIFLAFTLVFCSVNNYLIGQEKPITLHSHTMVKIDAEKQVFTKKHILSTITLDLSQNKVFIETNNVKEIYEILEVSKFKEMDNGLSISLKCKNNWHIVLDIKNTHTIRLCISKPLPNDPKMTKYSISFINYEIDNPLEVFNEF
jgi:hypothetical protein